jgi:hypothetical protein
VARGAWASCAGWAVALASRRWLPRAGGAGWAARAGLVDLAGPILFFLLKLEIHFGVSIKIGKMQMRYRWIRYEKYFNMRLNLEQKYKLYKTKN